MKFNGIKMLGKIFAQIVTNISSLVYDANYASTVILDRASGNLYYGDTNSSSFRTLTDIPTGSIFLFDSNTAMLGYTLLTNVDDRVVFIADTISYGGGGFLGDWSKDAHSHTLSGHTHNSSSHYHYFGSHTHSTASHRHLWCYYVGAGATYAYNSGGTPILLQAYGSSQNGQSVGLNEDGNDAHASLGSWYTSYSAPATTTPQSATNTGWTSGTSGAATGSSSTDTQPASSSWRPKGRNVTRQQRT